MDRDELINRFMPHKPTQAMVDKMDAARSQIVQTAALFDTLIEDCRQKSLAVHALEDALVWINKGITQGGEVVPAESPENRAQRAYLAYGEVTGGKNFLGNPMPTWDELTDNIKAAWIAASHS